MKARSAAGLTQEEVATRAGMDRSYLSDVERGEASLSVDRLFRVARALHVTAASLVQDMERKVPRHPAS